MSGSDDIDALVVARRLLNQSGRFRVTDSEVLAMASCLIGLDQWIDDLEAGPTTNARLAASIALAIQAFDLCGPDQGPAADRAFCAAFNSLKTIFEQEFPHV